MVASQLKPQDRFGRFVTNCLDLQKVDHAYRQKALLNPPAIVLNDMLYCNNIYPIIKYPYVMYNYYQWQSVRGDPKHFDILVILFKI